MLFRKLLSPGAVAAAILIAPFVATSAHAADATLRTAAPTQSESVHGIEMAPGCTSWTVPGTPNGLKPNQCWLSIAAAPDGDIYITGSDHKTNAALYRLDRKTDRLAYVGDARSASEAAGNWQPGETAEKFHVRPLFYKGRAYLATADYTAQDEGYRQRRGFHWYCYDPAANRMSDLSAGEPGGVGGAHASIIATTLDKERGLIYALSTPTCELFRYDIAAGRTEDLGHPSCVTKCGYMPGRYLWLGQRGRVYFTVSASDHVLYYDPETGFGETAWKIDAPDGLPKVFRTGAESADGERIYTVDEQGWIYRYDRRDDRFTRLGRAVSDDTRYGSRGGLKMRAFNITPDERSLYFINDDAAVSALWEWDVATGATRCLCDLSAIDGRIGGGEFTTHAGNDSWGADGCLYFCSFGTDQGKPTALILTRLDPVRLKVKLGLLPERTEVSAERKADTTKP